MCRPGLERCRLPDDTCRSPPVRPALACVSNWPFSVIAASDVCAAALCVTFGSCLLCRAGLDEFTLQLVGEFANIVYISCNPDTLHSNMLALKDSHDLKKLALFDQFPYSEHTEVGVYLQRKPGSKHACGASSKAQSRTGC